jgi:hypothetical protein
VEETCKTKLKLLEHDLIKNCLNAAEAICKKNTKEEEQGYASYLPEGCSSNLPEDYASNLCKAIVNETCQTIVNAEIEPLCEMVPGVKCHMELKKVAELECVPVTWEECDDFVKEVPYLVPEEECEEVTYDECFEVTSVLTMSYILCTRSKQPVI